MRRKNQEKILSRRFLGKVITSKLKEDGTPYDEYELKFENKHLRAYIQGKEMFKFRGKSFITKQEFYYENNPSYIPPVK